jgi:hypothetical protein
VKHTQKHTWNKNTLKKTIHAYHSTLTEPIAWARPRNNTKKLRKQKHITYSSRLENVLKRETMKQNTTKKTKKKLDNNKIKKKELKVMS